jgi:hypothetical protein
MINVMIRPAMVTKSMYSGLIIAMGGKDSIAVRRKASKVAVKAIFVSIIC